MTNSKYNLLVIRLTASGTLCDSKPCCMCANMMKIYGVKRVYYSNSSGEICYQKVDQLIDDPVIYSSHGLQLMIQQHTQFVKSYKLPLTKQQKTYLIYLK